MYNTPKSVEEIEKTISALKASNIEAFLAKDREDAKAKVFSLIPKDSPVMTMTSVTLDTLGISQEINESGNFNSVRTKLNDPNVSADEKRMLGAAPKITVGSVHAVTQDGKVIIASNTGSQLPAYAYGAEKVIWVVGTQKIALNVDDAIKRIYEYTLPLESERAHKAYGVDASAVNKMLIVNHENIAGRITIVFVPENIGF